MVYSSGLYHGGLPTCGGGMGSPFGGHWVADGTTASEHPHQTFHASLFLCSAFSFVCFVCTKHPLTV